MKNSYKTLFSNTMIFAVGNIGAKLISFLLVPLYTNILSTAEFGVTELVLTSSNLLIPILTLSIQDSTLRFGLEKKINKGEVLNNSIFILLIGSLLLIVALPIIRLYDVISEWYLYFAVITVFQMFRTVLSIYLKTINKNRAYAMQSILYSFLLAIFNILFLLKLRIGIAGYFYSMIISLIITTLYIVSKGKIISSAITAPFNIKLLKDMCIFSIPMIVNSISWWLVNSSNRFMIEYYLTSSEVGLYSAAAKIPSLVTVFTGIFQSAWTISSITEYDSSRDKSFFTNIFEIFSSVLLIATSGIILIIKPFMKIYVGETFFSSWRYVPFLLIGSVFLAYSYFFGSIYTAAKKNRAIASTTFAGAILGIILNVFLIPRIGIYGAAVSTMFSYLAIALFRAIDSRKYFAFNIKYKQVFYALLVLILQSVLCAFTDSSVISSIPCFLIISYIYRNYISFAVSTLKSRINKKYK